jgi:hypothetical protein
LGELFIESAFGCDRSKWDEAFPTYYIERLKRDQYMPQFLLLNANTDYGLDSMAIKLYKLLKDKGVTVEFHCYDRVNHFSITHFWKDKHRHIFHHILGFLYGVLGITNCVGR